MLIKYFEVLFIVMCVFLDVFGSETDRDCKDKQRKMLKRLTDYYLVRCFYSYTT